VIHEWSGKAMQFRSLTTASAVIAVGVMTIGAGVTAASVIRPATRASRAAAVMRAYHRRADYGTGLSTGHNTGLSTGHNTGRADLADSDGTRVHAGICTSPSAYRKLAARVSADIQHALHGRAGNHAASVYDAVTGIACHTDGARHFDSASIVKAIILAALLRRHQETGTPLSSLEEREATLMITQSDNDAATDLWNEVGMSGLQHFLDLAGMTETQLGEDGYWGLTQVTAHDEMLLLELLARPNLVLTADSRRYQLGLMARVIPGQRWGTPAGAPRAVTVHVKNGWLPDDGGWHINSIGAFTGQDRNYLIAVLTDANKSEQYGIDTIQAVARVVHRDLNESRLVPKARFAANEAPSLTESSPSPWAIVPALPTPAPAAPSAPAP
jgi:beta-lactamase class A